MNYPTFVPFRSDAVLEDEKVFEVVSELDNEQGMVAMPWFVCELRLVGKGGFGLHVWFNISAFLFLFYFSTTSSLTPSHPLKINPMREL